METRPVRVVRNNTDSAGNLPTQKQSKPQNKTAAHDLLQKTRGRQGFNSLGQYFADIIDHRDGLDATAETHRRRENGRFGSHPIHDRFDDESEP